MLWFNIMYSPVYSKQAYHQWPGDMLSALSLIIQILAGSPLAQIQIANKVHEQGYPSSDVKPPSLAFIATISAHHPTCLPVQLCIYHQDME